MRRLSLILFIVLLLSSFQVTAQNLITYGGATVSTLSAEAPIAIFTFQGAEDDQITLQVIGITPGLELSATVQSGTAILATADSDPFTDGSTDARIDARLPATNVYLILVASANGQTGDFLLKLSGQPATDKTVITGIPAEVPIVAGETSYYGFTGSPDESTVLNLASTSPDLQFLAIVRNELGQIIGTLSGTSSIVTVSGEGAYEIALSGVTSSMEGIVNVTSFEPDETDATPEPEATQADAPEPVVTEEVGDTPPDNTGACTVSSGGAVNVRSGPTTNDGIIAQMQPNQSYAVTGIYVDWYQINVIGIGTGWVFSGVVNTSGDCSGIPTVAPDAPAPTSPPEQSTATTAPDNGVVQATPTYTATTANQQVTATFTPSYTPTTEAQPPTATYTPSYTPTTEVVQVAQEDARFNNPLNIALDSTASVLDFVSYPGGDTEDRVRWDITGMNQNASISGGQARLVISVSCFGQNTDQIQFFTGGQTYSCGSTIVDQEVTFNSKTGSVVITAVGGSNTYVQWVLTGTATRLN